MNERQVAGSEKRLWNVRVWVFGGCRAIAAANDQNLPFRGRVPNVYLRHKRSFAYHSAA